MSAETLELLEKAVNDSAESMKTYMETVDKKIAELSGMPAELEEFRTQIEAIAKKSGRPGLFGGAPETKSLEKSVKAIAENPLFAEFKKGSIDKTSRIPLDIDLKTTLTSIQGSTASPQVGYQVQPQRIEGLFNNPQRKLTLLDLIPVIPATGNSAEFVQLDSSFSYAAAYQAGEGASKGEGSMPTVLANASIATIAWFLRASRQVLDDVPQLQGIINNLLTYGLRLKLEYEVINGSGASFHMSGLLHQAAAATVTATTVPDKIGEVISQLEAKGFTPSAIVLNPTDWFNIQIMKDAEERYLLGSPLQQLPRILFNVPVTPSPSMAAGTALIADTSHIALLDRLAATIMLSTSDVDNFTKNLVTVLAELRAGLAVYTPAALAKVDISD